MYTPVAVADTTPKHVLAFIRDHVDLYLHDLHGILRLPLPTADIPVACNFTCAAALVNVLAGLSVVLYEPGTQSERGRLFRETVERYYPWDTEPAKGVSDPAL